MKDSPARRVRRSAVVLTAALLAVVLLATGCSGFTSSEPGSLARDVDLSGQTYVVGSKDFDEQILLCQISIAALESAGASVTDRCDVGDTETTRQALLSGDISLYWEYTGTAWASFLRETRRLSDSEVLYELQQRDRRENGVVWLERAGFDNTYAFTVAGATAARLGLRTLSDMTAYLGSGQPGTVCVEAEYHSREDGLRGLQEAYETEFPPDRVQVLDQNVIYQSTSDGVCLFGEVAGTDGRIPGLGLRVLEDDRGYHITYSPVPTIRQDVFDRNPDIARVLDPISQALGQDTMQELNGRVSADGESARDVARDWLSERGFIGSP
ncbi:glycine betaine ABC transporter substrate-binding protein [Pseudonocardia nematodicida]|uniref:Glycine betaine ABC transporter substrate-binding protein n=1 Tax=Pseudonocardia nematodicida TaxID=1206997 RepID=A0ABV1KGB2_9PSEU